MTNHNGLPWTIQVLSSKILHLRNSLVLSKLEQLVTLYLLNDSIFLFSEILELELRERELVFLSDT